MINLLKKVGHFKPIINNLVSLYLFIYFLEKITKENP